MCRRVEALPPPERFEQALQQGLATLEQRAGIGTLKERSLHAVLKYWFAPSDDWHEQKVGRYVADVFDGEQIVEIQTGSTHRLRPKLDDFLPTHPVTVVLPLVRRKTLAWIDPASGESGKPRRSPKTGRFSDALPALYPFLDRLEHPHLTIALVLLDVADYRLQDGWGNDGKRGSHRVERVPTALGETLLLRSAADLRLLLPEGLPDPFTSADLSRLLRMRGRKLSSAISVLYKSGNIIRVGKDKNAFLYTVAAEPDGAPETAD